ncbi:MAG: 30S ribosome-binding factor RbfA [Bacteroidetes bacterium]|nr:MAG: 30S ribosome-binding factor RbfA [Bacteroidota bacterium]
MTESTRQKKMSRLVQKELGEILQREVKHLIGSVLVSVTAVRMSPDLGLARIFLSFFLAPDKEKCLAIIEQDQKSIKKLLVSRIRSQVRVVPELQFFLDDTMEEAQKIDDLLDSIKKESENKNAKNIDF